MRPGQEVLLESNTEVARKDLNESVGRRAQADRRGGVRVADQGVGRPLREADQRRAEGARARVGVTAQARPRPRRADLGPLRAPAAVLPPRPRDPRAGPAGDRAGCWRSGPTGSWTCSSAACSPSATARTGPSSRAPARSWETCARWWPARAWRAPSRRCSTPAWRCRSTSSRSAPTSSTTRWRSGTCPRSAAARGRRRGRWGSTWSGWSTMRAITRYFARGSRSATAHTRSGARSRRRDRGSTTPSARCAAASRGAVVQPLPPAAHAPRTPSSPCSPRSPSPWRRSAGRRSRARSCACPTRQSGLRAGWPPGGRRAARRCSTPRRGWPCAPAWRPRSTRWTSAARSFAPGASHSRPRRRRWSRAWARTC